MRKHGFGRYFRLAGAAIWLSLALVATGVTGASPASADPLDDITNVSVSFATTQLFVEWSGGPGTSASWDVQEYDTGTDAWVSVGLSGRSDDIEHSTIRFDRPALLDDVEGVQWRLVATVGEDSTTSDPVTFTMEANGIQPGPDPAPPSNVSVGFSTTRIYLEWSAGAGEVPATAHRVEYLDGTVWVPFDLEDEANLMQETYSTFSTDRPGDNLVPIHKDWRLIAISADDHESTPVAISFDVPPYTTVPSAPINLDVGFATSQYFLTWSTVTVPTVPVDFDVEQYDPETDEWVAADGLLEAEYSQFRLSRPSSHTDIPTKLRIRAINADDEVSDWAELDFDIPANLFDPSAPTDLDATVGTDDLTVTWNQDDEPSAPTGYELQQLVDDEWTAVTADVDVEGHSLTFARPSSHDDHDVTVRLRATDDTDGVSAWSEPLTFTVPANLDNPSAPTDLNATVGIDDITLSWNQDDDPVAPTGYDVQVKVGEDWYDTGLEADLETHTVTGSRPDSAEDIEVTLRVRGTDGTGGHSGWTEVTFTIPANQPSPADPTDLSATVGTDDIVLSWDQDDEPVAPTSYQLQVKVGEDWYDTGLEADLETHTITGDRPDLEEDQEITLRLRAIGDGGSHSAWVEVTFTIPANL